jgi:hypothetical protein
MIQIAPEQRQESMTGLAAICREESFANLYTRMKGDDRSKMSADNTPPSVDAMI